MKPILALAALLFALPGHAEVAIEWASLGEPGNACDLGPQGCFGSVGYRYRISKYEVTNAEYTEFLNAVAATDTYGLYNTNMGNPDPVEEGHGGITRSGSSGSYTYSTIAGREDMPVNYVSFYDALRFTNWLDNGQPTGAQDSTTTEDGAYTFSGAESVGARNKAATIFLPSENEWYKAAYYHKSWGPWSLGGSYYTYPAGPFTTMTCNMPGALLYTANCNFAVGDVTEVGGYTNSAGPNGTFDQGGNVWEWNETNYGSTRCRRGGSFSEAQYNLASWSHGAQIPAGEANDVGFRVAGWTHPVPSLTPVALALLGGLLGGFGLISLLLVALRRFE